MTTLYTAVGRFECRHDELGQRYPIIHLNQKELMLDIPEMIIWTSLSWRILELSQVEQLFQKKQSESGAAMSMSFDAYMSRLLQRGLITTGVADSGTDALYDLLGELYVVPTTCGICAKLLSFLKLTFIDSVPFSQTKKIFKNEILTDDERRVLGLAKQALLSTAEIIKCVEKDVYDVSSDDKILGSLYDDNETTSDNLAFTAALFRKKNLVILAVANLYLRKQIILERI